jgi:hypothetical protein
MLEMQQKNITISIFLCGLDHLTEYLRKSILHALYLDSSEDSICIKLPEHNLILTYVFSREYSEHDNVLFVYDPSDKTSWDYIFERFDMFNLGYNIITGYHNLVDHHSFIDNKILPYPLFKLTWEEDVWEPLKDIAVKVSGFEDIPNLVNILYRAYWGEGLLVKTDLYT